MTLIFNVFTAVIFIVLTVFVKDLVSIYEETLTLIWTHVSVDLKN